MESNRKGFFKFKQFEVEQTRSAMKVGMDVILLGSWVRITGDESRILDIGTGTGVIALMMAQRRSEANTESLIQRIDIDAVEIDNVACLEAKENFERSPWSDVLRGVCMPIQEFAKVSDNKGRYDLIISNPPYFMAGLDFRRGKEASEPTNAARVAARHAEMLPYDELIDAVKILLNPDEGKFAAIFPYQESSVFIAKAAAKGLYVHRIIEIQGAPRKAVKRVAAEFSLKRSERETVLRETIYIEDGQGNYSHKYRTLTEGFYLKL